ncbi:MAG: manganese efflux pump [Solirubrobacteraceae bacterium]
MLWLSAVLIATVSNLDNLGVGTAFGMRDTPVSALANLIIAAVTMAATAIAMTFGRALSQLIAPSIGSALGSAIIIAVGAGTVTTWIRTIRTPARSPIPAGAPPTNVLHRTTISPREALVLGVALSMNNLGAGVGAGVAGVPALATTVLAGTFSLLAVGGGSRIGWSVGRSAFGRVAPLIAGLVLLAVGCATLPGVG